MSAVMLTPAIGMQAGDKIMRGRWIAVGLDGTLAHELHDTSGNSIGTPLPAMVRQVHHWLKEGWLVKVLTHRAGMGLEQRNMVQNWLEKAGLPRLEVTDHIDQDLVELWDCRCVEVARNTGKRPPELAFHGDLLCFRRPDGSVLAREPYGGDLSWVGEFREESFYLAPLRKVASHAGEHILDASGRPAYRFDGIFLFDRWNSVVAEVDEIERLIDGGLGCEAAILWILFSEGNNELADVNELVFSRKR